MAWCYLFYFKLILLIGHLNVKFKKTNSVKFEALWLKKTCFNGILLILSEIESCLFTINKLVFRNLSEPGSHRIICAVYSNR